MSGPSRRSDQSEPSAAEAGTIAAIATAPGRGALAIVRVSGPAASQVGAICVRPWPLTPRVATLVTVRGGERGELVDRAIATWFAAPRSFTGEDVLEVATHGGAYTSTRVLAAVVRAGARPAEPGEFTRRAVLNGKLDLLRAEAIGDLVDAPSALLHRAALTQLSGALSARIAALRESLIELDALLAYDIDFPEEDDGPISGDRVVAHARLVEHELDRLLATLPAAQLGRDGAVVTVAGVPNAGKSSLFNALLGEARAIVTEHPGTTRDAIDVTIEAEPYPWRLVDTAGLRDAPDPVERLGVEVSERWLARADVVLLCGANARDRARAAAAIRGRTSATVLMVHTMADLPGDRTAADVVVSARTGEGLSALRQRVNDALAARHPAPPPDLPIILRARHERAVAEARVEVGQFIAAWSSGTVPASIAAIHIRAAVHALDGLIGAVDVDDVLDRVFSHFCVGK